MCFVNSVCGFFAFACFYVYFLSILLSFGPSLISVFIT